MNLSVLTPSRGIGAEKRRHHAESSERSDRQVGTFDTDLDAPLHLSPELVLVSPPDVARAAREALEPPPPEDAVAPLRKVTAPVRPADPQPAPVVPAPAPAAPSAVRRLPGRPLLLAAAIVLVGGGFLAGRELSGHEPQSVPAAAPATAATSAPATTGSTSLTSSAISPARPRRPAQPVVSWKPRPGIRRYRFDLFTGRVAILTIVTDEPHAQLPLSWPNAGRRRRLQPGRYAWTVRAATGTSRVIARGTVTVPKPSQS
jgi:hypothetical protein